jgi:hypothetical protein
LELDGFVGEVQVEFLGGGKGEEEDRWPKRVETHFVRMGVTSSWLMASVDAAVRGGTS